MGRKYILKEVEKCIMSDREAEYGNPEDNFTLIADLWNSFLNAKQDRKQIQAEDVGIMMSLLKIARISTGKPKADNYIDLAGYAICVGGIVANKAHPKNEERVKILKLK